jgi:hypothetical protein
MRTGTNHILDEEPDDTAFRQQLAAFDEPAPLDLPPDLVVRTTRHLPQETPSVLAQHERTRLLVRIMLAVLVFAALTFGAWSLLLGWPIPTPLVIQLMIKPLLGVVGALGLPLLLIGVLAAVGSGVLLGRYARTTPDMRVNA